MLSIRRYIQLVAVTVFAACAPQPRPPQPVVSRPPAASSMTEEEVRPAEKPQILITDLSETPSADHRRVTLNGTLENRGAAPTHEIFVHVEALDRDGAVVLSTDADPSSPIIAPGSTSRFAATFENRADIDHYHVEALSR